jgi:thiamine-phosphate pyrophosphorylase
MTLPIGRFHVLTDESAQDRFTHVEIARMAIAGGADTIQLREKQRGARDILDLAYSVRDICARGGVPLIINDRVDVALAVDADGVHVGQKDIDVGTARKLLGPDKIVGASVSCVDEALHAQAEGASYIGYGHIYATASKVKSGPPKGPESLAEIRRAVTIPVVAIGGIRASNVTEVLQNGAWGVAVIAAVCSSPRPQEAAERIAEAIRRTPGERGRT